MSICLYPGSTGVELGYAEITSNVTQTGLGSTDIAGLSVTVNVGARPILVKFGARSLTNSSASGVGGVIIKEGATSLCSGLASLTTLAMPIYREVRLAPSAGSHTYKAVITQLVTGNTTLAAASGEAAYIQVVEV